MVQFPPLISILGSDEKRSIDCAYAVLLSGGSPILCGWGEDLPLGTEGVLVLSHETDDLEKAALFVRSAAHLGLPILGIGWGMLVVNLAMGGVITEHTGGESQKKSEKKPIFLSPGGKISHIVGGSGWVSTYLENCRIRIENIADGLFVSCYSEDRLAYGIEQTGDNWVLGVGWDPCGAEAMPKGFDNLIPALIDRAQGDHNCE